MTRTLSRRVAGGALAVALASGIALAGAGAANAIRQPSPPSGDGAYVGQAGYTQAGSDPNIHKFTWNGSSWDYHGCYYVQVQ